MSNKIKIKVTCIEWTSKKVERVCEVDKDEYEQCKNYGIGYLDGGDLSTDAEGFNAKTISTKILDEHYEMNTKDVEWDEIEEEECDGVCKGDSSVTDCYGDCGETYPSAFIKQIYLRRKNNGYR